MHFCSIFLDFPVIRDTHMATFCTVQLCRACRRLAIARQWRTVRGLSSGDSHNQDHASGVSESISRQIIQAGFNSLKNTNLADLKKNASDRAAPVDIDELVTAVAS